VPGFYCGAWPLSCGTELLSSIGCASFSTVEYSCEQCGAEVESGRPFCPKCRAPQIRVEIEPLPPVASPSTPDFAIAPDPLNPARLGSSSDPAFFRTALQAGLLGVPAFLIPFGLGIVLTGILAAQFYQRASGGTLRGGKAARLGALAGAIAFGAAVLLAVLTVILFNLQQSFHDFLLKAFEESISRQSGPDVQAALQLIHTPQGFGIILVLSLVVVLLLSMLLSAVGGAIGSSLFRNRNPPPH
jgi:hypothetical protein